MYQINLGSSANLGIMRNAFSLFYLWMSTGPRNSESLTHDLQSCLTVLKPAADSYAENF